VIQRSNTGRKPQLLGGRESQFSIKNNGRRWKVGAPKSCLVTILILVACTRLTLPLALAKGGGSITYCVFSSAEGSWDRDVSEDWPTLLLLEEMQDKFRGVNR
jgi:hypothetical protein